MYLKEVFEDDSHQVISFLLSQNHLEVVVFERKEKSGINYDSPKNRN